MNRTKRKPIVAGQFYSADKNSLLSEIKQLIDNKGTKKEKAIGVIAPHAGFMYSGAVAGCVYSSIEIPEAVIILGPNHTGIGEKFSVFKEGTWSTPLGDVEIDEAVASAILSKCEFTKEDARAHLQEHSIEVQLPFIQYVKKNFKIVPIVLSQYNMKAYQSLADSIASAIKNSKKNIMIVASTDMTHYESQESAEKKDSIAIEAILNLDGAGLIKKVENLNITMCGYVPTAVMIMAAKNIGAKKAQLLKYQTSGDVTGDHSAVVGYAGVIIK